MQTLYRCVACLSIVYMSCALHVGMGPKRAVDAIRTYKNIEGIIKHKDKVPGVCEQDVLYSKLCTILFSLENYYS